MKAGFDCLIFLFCIRIYRLLSDLFDRKMFMLCFKLEWYYRACVGTVFSLSQRFVFINVIANHKNNNKGKSTVSTGMVSYIDFITWTWTFEWKHMQYFPLLCLRFYYPQVHSFDIAERRHTWNNTFLSYIYAYLRQINFYFKIVQKKNN